jgi:hypothetical protein
MKTAVVDKLTWPNQYEDEMITMGMLRQEVRIQRWPMKKTTEMITEWYR